MLKSLIREVLAQALEYCLTQNTLPLPPDVTAQDVNANLLALNIERPKQSQHGDFAINVSGLARSLKLAPPAIAQALAAGINTHANGVLSATALGGFLNLTLGQQLQARVLLEALKASNPGENTRLAHERFLLEFVSANPTGPLHIGHGRWAALGDSLRRILKQCGAQVTSEFYINDAGNQMRQLARSLWWRCFELCYPDAPHQFPQKPAPIEGQPPLPYPYYPGEYLIPVAEAYLSEPSRKQKFIDAWKASGEQTLESVAEEHWPPAVTDLLFTAPDSLMTFGRDLLLKSQQDLLKRFGVPFEIWFSEKTEIHDTGLLTQTLDLLRQKSPDAIYEQEGALWFRSSDYGDEKDRVLQKSSQNGQPGPYTYLTADIAYHHVKYRRTLPDGEPAYNRILNIWGADHHGYIARLRAAIEALGHSSKHFEILLGQLVNLIISGEKTRMGKRRSMLTLEDVIDDVGVDATRFWMVSKSADTALDFDVDLAASATDDNPVFYAQYAHARCSGVVRNVIEPRLNVDTQQSEPALLSVPQLAEYQKTLTPEGLAPLFKQLEAPKANQASPVDSLKTLLFKLDSFEEVLLDAARLRAPHLIARYTLDLSADFHAFYNVCRIITPDPALTQARLMVVLATRKVLAKALYLLGVSAPDKL